VLDPEADDVAELVLVQALLDRGDEGHREPGLGAVVEGGLLGPAEVAAADLEVGALVEAVELQVDVRLAVEAGEGLHEAPVVGELDPVRVQVDRAHALVHGQLDEVEDQGVDGGLPARVHDDLGLALGGDEGVERGGALLHREREAVGLVARVGEADRAVQVAVGVDLDDPEAGVLLVVRA
jgi:hypothetical protein